MTDPSYLLPSNQIPVFASPRGELGNVSEVKCMMCQPSQPQRIWETLGDSTRLLAWRGPGFHSGLDLRTCCNSGNFDRLLLNQVTVGASSAYLPETHRGQLIKVDSSPAANKSLEMLGRSLTNAYESGAGLYNIDEYCAIFHVIPAGFTKEQFLAAFLRAPFSLLKDDSGSLRNILARGTFDDPEASMCFQLMQAGTNAEANNATMMPTIGDWYRIRLPGNNGNFMIVHAESKPRRSVATIQSVTDQERWMSDDTPVVGRRQFGIEHTSSGAWRFFIRGFDRPRRRPDPEAMGITQHVSWTDIMRSLAAGQGGHAEQTGIWGWMRQIPGEVLASSMLGGCPEMGDA